MAKKWRRLLIGLLLILAAANAVAAFHAWKFTHFSTDKIVKTGDPKQLSTVEKLLAVATGVSNPRPANTSVPSLPYQTIALQSNKKLECWLITHPSALGTIALFHGYSGTKSTMLDKADEFYRMGYSVLLVDFMGSGGSEGNQTTVGYKEAEEVATCYGYLDRTGEKNILLFGTSMGAAAILKAVPQYQLHPSAILLECPFGSMYQTICARFRQMGIPPVPMAMLLNFWGGVENGFPSFSYQPARYAQGVHCPTLLLHGSKDPSVSAEEVNNIFTAIQHPHKKLVVFPGAVHENYLLKYRTEWQLEVADFLAKTKKL